MKYGIVINQSSGSVRASTPADIIIFLDAAKIDFELRVVPPSAMIKTTLELLKTGCDAIVAGGGDGSLSSIAKIAIKQKLPFAVLPLGTLNHFAGDLGICNLQQALSVLAEPKIISIDYVSLNEHIVLNNSSVGIYPELVFRREDREERIGKWPAAGLSLIEILSQPLRSLRLQLTIDGVESRILTPSVFIGNNDYGFDRFGLNRRSSLREGKLSVVIFTSRQRRVLFWHLIRLLVGRPKPETAKIVTATAITIAGKKQFDVSIDGESIVMESPLVYQIHPQGLKLLVPQK